MRRDFEEFAQLALETVQRELDDPVSSGNEALIRQFRAPDHA